MGVSRGAGIANPTGAKESMAFLMGILLFMSSCYMSLCFFSSALCCPLQIPRKTMFGSYLPPFVCRGFMFYLF